MHKSEAEILLVEDNPADCELTLHALRSENLCNHIHVARDGEEADGWPSGSSSRGRVLPLCTVCGSMPPWRCLVVKTASP